MRRRAAVATVLVIVASALVSLLPSSVAATRSRSLPSLRHCGGLSAFIKSAGHGASMQRRPPAPRSLGTFVCRLGGKGSMIDLI